MILKRVECTVMDNKYSDNDLRNRYTAYGHFYNLDYGRTPALPCRSILDLIDNGYLCSYIKMKGCIKPSAIAIMMNPGNSRPISDHKLETFTKETIPNCDWQFVEAVPDDTQYQLMRLMIRFEWKCVRVINLTDIREPSSKNLKPYIHNKNRINSHSIFNRNRKIELNNILNSNTQAPIIVAWGVYYWLKGLINPCLSTINHRRIVGFRKDRTDNMYYHPLPRRKYPKSIMSPREQWIKEVVDSIETL